MAPVIRVLFDKQQPYVMYSAYSQNDPLRKQPTNQSKEM